MRSLVASSLCIAVIIIGWIVFMNYSDDSVDELMALAGTTVYDAVDREDWDTAKKEFEDLTSSWEKNRKKYIIFLEQEYIFDIDITLSRAHAYLNAESKDQTLGELYALKKQFSLLHLSESLSWANII